MLAALHESGVRVDPALRPVLDARHRALLRRIIAIIAIPIIRSRINIGGRRGGGRGVDVGRQHALHGHKIFKKGK